MFRICVDFCERHESSGPYSVYDPCCGCGTLLTVVGLLNLERVRRIVGSDIDPASLATARNNLALLTAEGTSERLRQIENDYLAYRKLSHRDAVGSAIRIRELVTLGSERSAVKTVLLHLDATRLAAHDIESVGQPDIILSDVPYGVKSQWIVQGDELSSPISLLLESLLSFQNKPIIAIAADKGTRVQHPSYRRLKRLSAGKRQIVFLHSV